MQSVIRKNTQTAERFSPWFQFAARFLPLWMVALAVSAEGFPGPSFPPVTLAVILFFAAIPVGIWIVVKGWAWLEIVLIALVPLYYWVTFDEITTAYKTPFILFCTLIISLGLIAYEPFTRQGWRWLLVVGAVILALWAANHAASNFWAYHDFLGVGECFLDFPGCPSLPAEHPGWWWFFFS